MHPDAIAHDALDLELIRRELGPGLATSPIHLFDEVRSTNEVLRDMARAGAGAGTVVLAECQTAGRGRAGQPWFSPPGVNLYASALFRPAIPPKAVTVFSFIASLALADAIQELVPGVAIKWPNDILVKGKKVAGVLAEAATVDDRVESVILGVGVNLNVTRRMLADALGDAAHAATSLREVLNRAVDRNAFTATFLNYLDEWHTIHAARGSGAVLDAWRERDILTGRRVQVREGARAFDGRVRGLDADGHLEVEDSLGRTRRVVAGEIRSIE
jgi:BirA family biotin operon repressor/biotin-[acetyl-CoA-carboxylase] ligase